MKVILGIGNPGQEYQKNLHNVGFMALDAIAKLFKTEFNLNSSRYFSWISSFPKSNESVLFLKPKTYVNLTGRVVEELLKQKVFQNLQECIENFLVICDDIYLPLGKMRFRQEGSSGGHNGLKSIEAVLGNTYQRLKLGVADENGKLPPLLELREAVLSDFRLDQEEQLQKTLEVVAQSVEIWLKQGIMSVMNQFNGIYVCPKIQENNSISSLKKTHENPSKASNQASNLSEI